MYVITRIQNGKMLANGFVMNVVIRKLTYRRITMFDKDGFH